MFFSADMMSRLILNIEQVYIPEDKQLGHVVSSFLHTIVSIC